MSSGESWMELAMVAEEEEESFPNSLTFDKRSGFDSQTGIYHSLVQLDQTQKIPTQANLDTATFVLSQFPPPSEAETQVALIDSETGHRVTYAQLHDSITKLATGLYHGLRMKKGDVVFILSSNSLLYPTICLAVLSIGAIITTANPLNTASEIAKQVHDSGAKLAISAPEEVNKLTRTGIPILLTQCNGDDNQLSVQELIENCEQLEIPEAKPVQSDTAAILYSSGTTGTSKGVVLTHSNFISIMTLLKWSVDVSNSKDDVFLCFIPMFHIYGLAFFGLGLFCSGTAVPPILLSLVKYSEGGYDLTSLRRMGSGAAPLSKEVVDGFRKKFPWVQLRPGYGLTESCGAATYFASDDEAKARPASSARLVPCFKAKVVDCDSGLALPPFKKGELWLKSPTKLNGLLANAGGSSRVRGYTYSTSTNTRCSSRAL